MFPSRSGTILDRIAQFTAATITTREANEMNYVPVANIISALVFTILGIVVFVLAFLIMDKVTPYHLWKEIVQEHNMALAILVGAMSIGICIIIASAIH
jgi:putative membrane protein